MAVLVAPTKSNLIKAKASLELSNKGFELMDKKRNVLIKEMMSLVERAKQVQSKIYDKIDEAYNHLQYANITSGIKKSLTAICKAYKNKLLQSSLFSFYILPSGTLLTTFLYSRMNRNAVTTAENTSAMG